MYKKAINQYASMNAHTGVVDADPHQLILLLMEGALARMAAAKGHIQRSEHEAKAKVMGNIVSIIGTLQSSLNHEQGGEISQNLEKLYDYMTRRLFDATRLNDVSMVDEVMGLLLEVKNGWLGIREEYLSSIGKTEAVTSNNQSANYSV
jgi:flagellar protein FliS